MENSSPESTQYRHDQIEPKWQRHWEKKGIFSAENNSSKPKYYVLDMFPYPSSQGLHVGHPEGYTASDIVARFKRAQGFNVLHPMGWDAFGLPAEQYAIQTGVHPEITTTRAIEVFKRQLKALGFSFDWNREISTCSPHYYKWTQFIFLKLQEKGLVYQKEVPVNWCPELRTVLANEEVVDGKSERGGHPVFRQPMKQWMLRITDYAERLLEDLDGLDWPESTKELQRNWIGKSTGLTARFAVKDSDDQFEIFTTRPDTIYGVTYMVLAPEHPLVEKLTKPEQAAAVKKYKEMASRKSEIDRSQASKEKTGVFLGSYAINPFSGSPVPIWVADYVLMGYGTGAIMAVPAHDERDLEFAKTFSLPVRPVINEKNICINSGVLDGLETSVAVKRAIEFAKEKGFGRATTHYKLRDWLFSRQRYWGEPFPVINFDDGSKRFLEPGELPVLLPKVESYEPSGTGESPLAAISSWVDIEDGNRPARRETDTMPGSAGSSWYFLRYTDPHNPHQAFGFEAQKYWMPVDLYVGGAEHAVGHLLYSRFWTKVLYDLGLVSVSEPFKKLVHQGMILGTDGEKMSKSRGNVINPDDIIRDYGADSLRVYEMFMGPLDRDKPWSTKAIEGVHRFLNRAWRIFEPFSRIEDLPLSPQEEKLLHKTIAKVTQDIEELKFNTAISQMMIFVNEVTAGPRRPRLLLRPFVQLLAPFAPHLAEEIWSQLGEKSELSFERWPEFDPRLAKDETVTIAVQVMGKLRGTLEVTPGTAEHEVISLAKTLKSVEGHLASQEIKKAIFVKDKIVNFVLANK